MDIKGMLKDKAEELIEKIKNDKDIAAKFQKDPIATVEKLIGIDQDRDAISAASKRLEDFGDKLITVNRNFSEIKEILDELGIDKIDGAVSLDFAIKKCLLEM